MPTTKTRISIAVPRETELYLQSLADRDSMPLATKARELLETALEIEEDAYWLAKLKEREVGETFVSWKVAKKAFDKVINASH